MLLIMSSTSKLNETLKRDKALILSVNRLLCHSLDKLKVSRGGFNRAPTNLEAA